MVNIHYIKKRSFISFVGTMHWSFFPNHLYRLRAIKEYTASRINEGTIQKICIHFQYQERWLDIFRAAADFL